jgi:hypothetical protein
MKQVDMSTKAVTDRLKRVSQLRRLCLSLQKAKLPVENNNASTSARSGEADATVKQKAK